MRSISLFVLSFLIAARAMEFLLAEWWGGDGRYEISVALERVRREPDVDTLFVGTSRVKYGVDPEGFDAAMKRHGLPTHSYILAVNALSFVEMEFLLHRLFKERPCCIKYVFLEADMTQEAQIREPSSIRSTRYYDIGNAYSSMTYVLGGSAAQSTPTKWDYLGYIAVAVPRHYSNLGLFNAFSDERLANFRAAAENRGYVSAWTAHTTLEDLFRRDNSLRKQYSDQLNAISRPPPRGRISDRQVARLVALTEFIRSQGAAAMVLRTTQYIGATETASVVERVRAFCPGATIIDFGDPREYPDLFAPQLRRDYDHLSGPGADRFTQMVADKFAALLRSPAVASKSSAGCASETSR